MDEHIAHGLEVMNEKVFLFQDGRVVDTGIKAVDEVDNQLVLDIVPSIGQIALQRIETRISKTEDEIAQVYESTKINKKLTHRLLGVMCFMVIGATSAPLLSTGISNGSTLEYGLPIAVTAYFGGLLVVTNTIENRRRDRSLTSLKEKQVRHDEMLQIAQTFVASEDSN